GEDSLKLHVAFGRRLARAQLDIAVLSDGGDARRQAARESDQDVFDRGRAPVLGRKDLGVIGIELEGGLAALLLAEAEKAFDRRVTVGAVLPFARGAPLELRRLWRAGQ